MFEARFCMERKLHRINPLWQHNGDAPSRVFCSVSAMDFLVFFFKKKENENRGKKKVKRLFFHLTAVSHMTSRKKESLDVISKQSHARDW
jgi:hypothetical protein